MAITDEVAPATPVAGTGPRRTIRRREFVICSGTPPKPHSRRRERIRHRIGNIPSLHRSTTRRPAPMIRVTCSVGAAISPPRNHLDNCSKPADNALRTAKQSGPTKSAWQGSPNYRHQRKFTGSGRRLQLRDHWLWSQPFRGSRTRRRRRWWRHRHRLVCRRHTCGTAITHCICHGKIECIRPRPIPQARRPIFCSV